MIEDHGTMRLYRQGCRCEMCKRAQRRYAADGRRRRAEAARAGSPDVPHGRGGYTNWHCRCDVCKEAGREMNAAWYAANGPARGGNSRG